MTMLSEKQIKAINAMNEEQLKTTISIQSAGSHADRDEIIGLCEKRLDALNVDNALVEQCDMSDFGDM